MLNVIKIHIVIKIDTVMRLFFVYVLKVEQFYECGRKFLEVSFTVITINLSTGDSGSLRQLASL